MNKPFDRIITVMFENQYRSYAMQNPFLKKLASAGANMTNYFGAFHPSQTNYLASLAGEVCGVTNDTPPAAPLMQDTLVDLLEAKNVSWKAYMEAYPGDPWKSSWQTPNYPEKEQPITQFPPANAAQLSRYYRKHNAFASFHSTQKEESRWNKIVSDQEFWNDVAHENLPEYSWFTPDIWNDGHYLYNTHIDTDPRTQLIPQLSAWLEHVFLGNIPSSKIEGGTATCLPSLGLNLDVDLLLTDPDKAWKQSNVPKGTLLVITFDEADFNAVGFDTMYDGPNQIYTVLLGDMIAPGTTISTPYNHYNLIRTVEENFQLGSLYKNDFGANWFRFLWNEKFSWNLPKDSDFMAGNALAITNEGTATHMVFSTSNNMLCSSILSQNNWSSPHQLTIKARGPIAFSNLNNTSVLVHLNKDNNLVATQYSITTKTWSESIDLGINCNGSFALTTYYDHADATKKLMLCWTGMNGFMYSMLGAENGFSGTHIPVNQRTDGAMTMGQVGASLFLAYKEINTRKMRMTSFNTGKFNSFNATDFQGKPAPHNDTSIHSWAVADFAIGHFSKKMAALANEYQNIGSMAMATMSGEMHLIHPGGYPNLDTAFTEVFGLTGIYSASHQLSNNYGTLHQAGWTLEEVLSNIHIDSTSPIAMCSDGDNLTFVWLDTKSGTLQYTQGTYSKK